MPQQKTREERIMEITDIVHLSTESLALINAAQIDIDLNDLKLWYFKNYVLIGSQYVVEYIAWKNRQKEKILEQQAQVLETNAAQNATNNVVNN